MAEVRNDESLQPEIGRDLCRVRTEGENYRGYKKYILTENLSEREYAAFLCPRCKGILRDLCISTDGQQFCSCCKKEGEQTHPNIHMNNTILCFKCSCPLIVRGCSWLGTLGDCENHLDTCGYVQETCKLKCGVRVTRNELTDHMTDQCVQRVVTCEHCEKNFKFCELPEHLVICPKMKVSCELECGVVMCREEVAQHINRYCKEKEIECPFAKYKCVRLIKRKDLNTHLMEKETEHLKLRLNAIEDIVMRQSELVEKQNESITGQGDTITKLTGTVNDQDGVITKQDRMITDQGKMLTKLNGTITDQRGVNTKQNETISDQGKMITAQKRKIETMSQEISSLNKIMQQLLDPIKFHWEITKDPRCHGPLQSEFKAAGYIYQFYLFHRGDNLQIDFCLKDGTDYDKLDWPFRAKFVIHVTFSKIIRYLFSQHERKHTKVFRSEVVEVQRGDVSSKFRIADMASILSACHPFDFYVALEISILLC